MTIVPLTGPRSTSCARSTISLYQAEKSSLCAVTPRSSLAMPDRLPTLPDPPDHAAFAGNPDRLDRRPRFPDRVTHDLEVPARRRPGVRPRPGDRHLARRTRAAASRRTRSNSSSAPGRCSRAPSPSAPCRTATHPRRDVRGRLHVHRQHGLQGQGPPDAGRAHREPERRVRGEPVRDGPVPGVREPRRTHPRRRAVDEPVRRHAQDRARTTSRPSARASPSTRTRAAAPADPPPTPAPGLGQAPAPSDEDHGQDAPGLIPGLLGPLMPPGLLGSTGPAVWA